MESANNKQAQRALRKEIRAQHPGLRKALLADTRITCANRAERFEFRSRTDAVLQALRLLWSSDAFLAQQLYRVRARLLRLGVPILPRVFHGLAMTVAQVAIGPATVIAPGVYILHGQVVIDGFTRIGSGVLIGPFVSIGLVAGDLQGPTIESNVTIGTGARVLGPVRIGAGANVGANAVVLDDVPPNTTVVGAPARPVGGRAEATVLGD